MKTLWLIELFAVLLSCLILAPHVLAQSGKTVRIKNDAGESRKLCIYDINDRVGIVPERCFTIPTGESVTWNRDGNVANFQVKIFRPQLFDQYLYTRRLRGDTTVIVMGKGGRFAYSRQAPNPPPTKYRLKVCNQQFDQRVYFVLGFETNQVFATEGWWSVDQGKCVEIQVSERLKRQWNVDYGNLPHTFYYAKILGPKMIIWSGGDSDYSLCINYRNSFSKKQFTYDLTGKYVPLECDGREELQVKFRRLPDPKANQEYYYLTF